MEFSAGWLIQVIWGCSPNLSDLVRGYGHSALELLLPVLGKSVILAAPEVEIDSCFPDCLLSLLFDLA